MKTTNQFDYPTAAATSFKAYKQPTSPSNAKNQQAHYKQTIKQSSEFERNKVKEQQQRRKQIESEEQRNRIRQEIEKKKKELEELQQKKLQAIEGQRRAEELAKIKEEQDKIKLIQKEHKEKENQENAQFRFKDALRRLEVERQEKATRERQAEQRRRANQEAEKVGRQQAIKFKDWIREKQQEDKERALEQETRQAQYMRNGLGRCGFNRAVDYSKTCLHNPNMIFKSREEGPTAFERGESQERRQQQIQAEKRQRQQEARKRSLERGENALQRISRQRQYQEYTREAQQQQREYNIKRIEEGKRNQYVGLKPLTLAQMEANKKLRGQEEFQNQFLGPQVAVYQAPASKYMIIETKYPQNETVTSRQFNYSYESNPEYSIKGSTHQKYLQEEDEHEEMPQELNVQPMRVLNKPMAETRAEEAKPQRQDLYYSQSEEDSSYA